MAPLISTLRELMVFGTVGAVNGSAERGVAQDFLPAKLDLYLLMMPFLCIALINTPEGRPSLRV